MPSYELGEPLIKTFPLTPRKKLEIKKNVLSRKICRSNRRIRLTIKEHTPY